MRYNKTNVTYIDTRVNVSNHVTVANLTFGINADKLLCLSALEGAGVDIEAMFDKYYEYCGIGDYTDNNGVTSKQIVFKTVGRAKLRNEDKANRDSIIGERLAISEAQKKAFSIASRLQSDLYNATIIYIITPLAKYRDGAQKSTLECVNHRKNLINHYYNF